MPYDWIEPHQGNIPQINAEKADQDDTEKAISEDRSRSLRVPGIKPGMLVGEEGAERGVAATDPRGLVFDHDTGVLRPISDDDYEKPRRASRSEKDDDDKPATQRQQEERERNAPRHVTVTDKK
jgi:hypothetical protein